MPTLVLLCFLNLFYALITTNSSETKIKNKVSKMSRYSQIMYSLQEKITHFRLEVSVVYVVLAHFELKKSHKIQKDF